MVEWVVSNYTECVLFLAFLGVFVHLVAVLVGFDEGMTIKALITKAATTANVAIVVPLFGSIKDPKIFEKLSGYDGVVILAGICIVYMTFQELTPRYLAERIKRGATKRYQRNMEQLERE
jgi:hypothetical protein